MSAILSQVPMQCVGTWDSIALDLGYLQLETTSVLLLEGAKQYVWLIKEIVTKSSPEPQKWYIHYVYFDGTICREEF